MDVRVPEKEYKKYLKIFNANQDKYPKIQKEDGTLSCLLTLTKDDTIEIPLIMVKNNEDKLICWSSGKNNITSMLKKGYVELREKCHNRFFLFKCKGPKCRYYRIQNSTGDCGFYWKTMIY